MTPHTPPPSAILKAPQPKQETHESTGQFTDSTAAFVIGSSLAVEQRGLPLSALSLHVNVARGLFEEVSSGDSGTCIKDPCMDLNQRCF